jgi:hypothetical protein
VKLWIVVAVCSTIVLFCAGARAQDTNRVPDLDNSVKAVEGSVHADTQEPVLPDLQLSQKLTKGQTPYSRWGFPTADETSATRFWAANTATPAVTSTGDDASTTGSGAISFQAGTQGAASSLWPARQSASSGSNLPEQVQPPVPAFRAERSFNPSIKPERNDRSGHLEGRHDSFNKWTLGGSASGSKETGSFRTKVPVLPQQPETDGFSTPFHGEPLGLTKAPSSMFNDFPTATRASKEGQIRSKPRKHPPHKASSSTDKVTGLASAKKQRVPGFPQVK